MAEALPQLSMLLPRHFDPRVLPRRPDNLDQNPVLSEPVHFSLLVYEGKYADKFHLVHFDPKLYLNKERSEFSMVPVRVYAFEHWALSKSDSIDCNVGLTVLGSAASQNVSIQLDNVDSCFGSAGTLAFALRPLLDQEMETVNASVSSFSFMLVLVQLSVIFFAFCAKYN